MKTTSSNLTARREAHHKALERLAIETGGQCNPGLGKHIWNSLMRLERQANQANLDLCNVPNYQEKAEVIYARVRREVSNLFGGIPRGFFINRDPRGHALKLDNETVTIPEGMDKDWGGNGILAAEIND